ncbi:hypothetical protein KW507_04175 [Vibrio fluvialis]|nr:hypothetical protein [Vibrio fluvialis]
MKKFFEIVGWIAGLISIIGTAIGIAWFFFGLEGRVNDLEKQMQAIYQVSLQSTDQAVSPSKEEPGVTQSSDSEIHSQNISKLVDTCSELALRVADAYKDVTPLTVAQPLEKMMKNLGCEKLIQ